MVEQMKSTFQRVILIVALVNCFTVQAQTQRSGGDSARVVQQMQQVMAEKSRLQQENDALKKELEALKVKSSQVAVDLAKAQQRINQYESETSKQLSLGAEKDSAIEKSKAQLQDLVVKYREVAQSLKQAERDRDAQSVINANKDKELAGCVDKNAQLYVMGNEFLDRLESQGIWSVIRTKESFIKLGRTQLENLVDDYRDRIAELTQTKIVSTAKSTH